MRRPSTRAEAPAKHDGPETDPAGEIGRSVTPSMAQYLEIKTANPDSLLWYRMGDFYELFFEDAVVAAEALGIVLTKRGKHLGQDIPMCGVPVVRADEYLQRLIRLGHRVAVCEQLEDPAEARKRGSKAVVRRDVVRLVTPGTLTEEALLDARARNFLIALFRPTGSQQMPEIAIAAFELSTGELEIGTFRLDDLGGELARLAPREVLVAERGAGPVGRRADTSDAGADLHALLQRLASDDLAVTHVPAPSFDSFGGETDLTAALGVADLGAFGSFTRAELACVGALLRYVHLTQVGQRPVVRAPRRIGAGATLTIDAATRSSLELTRSARGERAGSLLAAVDRTVTGAGARELASRLAAPLTDPAEINARLDAVAYFTEADYLRDALRSDLRGAPDIARALSRLALMRGGPRDLAAVRDALRIAGRVRELIKLRTPEGLPREIETAVDGLTAAPAELGQRLLHALVEDPPATRRDVGFVKDGVSSELDTARALSADSHKVMEALETRYIEETGVKALKLRHNNILGYFLEAPAGAAKPLLEPPLSATFRHRQTMANAVRFTTDDLARLEGQVASAGERALAIEQEIFAELAREIGANERALTTVATGLAVLDCIVALAELAREQDYSRPDVHAGPGLAIAGGRHPVVEQALKALRGDPFIENDCVLGEPARQDRPPGFEEAGAARIWLVTGPNMAGKSTFLRQCALIVLMAQAGSFVPAMSARIGVVDRLFSRVGASDDLARGRSTFMVEMVETAAILNQATARSLVILDEIGRGTATYDGLSIAWATVEHLHDAIGCRALFATHYHELTALTKRLSGLANVTMDVKEHGASIVFLHRVRPGAADRSYGIHVARLAGLPEPVIARASEVLETLETSADAKPAISALDDLPLFSAARPKGYAARRPSDPSAVEALVDTTHPDELTPRAALDVLYRLKALRREA
ncbi:MAG: DNA mismatch repair protein MutS [Hyphomicrobiaceae bacterium]